MHNNISLAHSHAQFYSRLYGLRFCPAVASVNVTFKFRGRDSHSLSLCKAKTMTTRRADDDDRTTDCRRWVLVSGEGKKLKETRRMRSKFDYTAVSVWLWDESRSTSISGTVSSSGSGHMSAYSRDDPCDKRLLSDDCFFNTAARFGFEGRASRPCRKALTTRIWKKN